MSLYVPRLWARLRPLAGPLLLILVVLGHVAAASWWLAHNPMPNGYQNEILHLGNALDLWVVLQFHNWPQVHEFLFRNYWPPLHYLSALSVVGLTSTHRDMFVASNYLFLAGLLGATYGLGRQLFTPGVGLLAAVLLSLFPSIFGNLVHFEPNVALTALVGGALFCLVASRDFTRRGYSVAFGVCCGAGLLVDRLAFAFFVWAPVLGVFWRLLSRGLNPSRRRAASLNGVLAAGMILLIAGYFYFNFFTLHRDEIFSQATRGEIIETGEQTEHRDPLALTTLLFYPLTLFDSQVGPALTLLLLPALLLGAWGFWRSPAQRVVVSSWLGAWLVFTLIQKKQVFYTIPVLVGVALMAAWGFSRLPWPRLRHVWLALTLWVALHQFTTLTTGRGVLPANVIVPGSGGMGVVDLRILGGLSPLPESWVGPRYPQARPPDNQDLHLKELVQTVDTLRGGLPVFRVGVFSEDAVMFEGYVQFYIRSAIPWIRVNGLISNAQGFYEWARTMDLFVYVTPSTFRTWPSRVSIDETLIAYHRYDPDLPVAEVLSELHPKFDLHSDFTTESGAHVFIYIPTAGVKKEGGSEPDKPTPDPSDPSPEPSPL